MFCTFYTAHNSSLIRSMPKHKSKGPISLQGAVPAPAKQVSEQSGSPAVIPLRVRARPPHEDAKALPAALHFCETPQLQDLAAQRCLLQLASGSDCILTVSDDASVPAGCILLDEVQRHNLHAAAGEVYNFSVYEPPSEDSEAGPFQLVELEVEVQPLESSSASSSSSSSSTEALEVDARELAALLGRQYFGRVLAVNEFVALELHGAPLLLRITATHNLTEQEQEEAIACHCYRGLVTPDTRIHLHALEFGAAGDTRFGRLGASCSSSRGMGPNSRQPSGMAAASHGSPSSGEQCSVLGREGRGGASGCTAGQQLAVAGPAHSSSGGTAHNNSGGTAAAAAAFSNDPACCVSSQQALRDTTASTINGAAGTLINNLPHNNLLHDNLPQSRAVRRAGGIRLLHAPPKEERRPPTNVVLVHTTDGDGEGECFPVKKRLLRPCVALTKVVRDSGESVPSVTVDVGTLTFDRVLMYLEALALSKPAPSFALHLLDDLQQAARRLGLRSLEELCAQRLGDRAAALSTFTVADVAKGNAAGRAHLMLDGMVLDVTRWLPEHPGGSTIIPEQALDVDCSRFFEMYHASRESFLYLKEFYIGELLPAEKAAVVPGGGEVASPDFMQQLRQYTTWRIPPEQLCAKAFW